MKSVFLGFANKDLLIFILLFILTLCLFLINRLKRLLAQEIDRRINPQLLLELTDNPENNELGFYLKNDSFFAVKDIKVEDTEIAITEYGIKQKLILRFEQIDLLKPKEKIKLTYKAFDKENRFLESITDKIIPHLFNEYFQIQIRYTTVFGRNLSAAFSKKGQKFYCEKIEAYQVKSV